jgi:CRP-like cAMP-binding protein
MSDLIVKLRAFITNLNIPISEESMAEFEKIWTVMDVKRKTIITQSGEVEKHIYFVINGVQRIYYLDDQNREATLVFSYPHSFAGVIDSFLLRSPSKYYFETLTNSTLLRVDYKTFKALIEKYNDIDLMIQKLSIHALSGVLERMAELQCYSSEEKFRSLLKRSPHILNHVPQKYLANYLGIDPTNFSKLINSIRI